MFKVSKGLNILLVVIALAQFIIYTGLYQQHMGYSFLILLIIFGAISILSILKKKNT